MTSEAGGRSNSTRIDGTAKSGTGTSSEALLPLVVDLDEALCTSDTLLESILALVPLRPIYLLKTIASAFRRARFREIIADGFRPDPATLPYFQPLVAYLDEQKQAGRYLVLATAADQRIADGVAAHLGLFDTTFGSADGVNLMGEAKRDLLVDRFGENGFEYICASQPDLPVWKAAAKVHAIRSSSRMEDDAQRASVDLVSLGLPVPFGGARAVIRALRPHQWLKNLLVFLPILAAHKIDIITLSVTFLTFVVFSSVASGAYLLNDLMDLENDRKHRTKKDRPFASGALRPSTGLIWSGFCIAFGVVIALLFLSTKAALVIVAYFVATTAYSLVLKQMLILDLVVLSLLYATRVLAGGVGSATPISDWMMLFCVFFFFGLSAVKRITEVRALEASGGAAVAGRAYTVQDLWVLIAISVGSTLISVLVFALYATSGAVAVLYSDPRLVLLVCPLLIYWSCRTVILAHRGELHDDPVVFAVRDPISLLTAATALALLAVAATV